MPGAVGTTASGINNAGLIVGTWTVVVGEQEHGLVRDPNGSFTQLDVPGVMRTDAFGINDNGLIVGAFIDNTGGEHGFLARPVVFGGMPGKPNCFGKSVSALARQYGGLNAAAEALGFPSVRALQKAILEFCEG